MEITPRVGYDCDGVLSCFQSGFIKRAKSLGFDCPNSPADVKCWNVCDSFTEVMRDAWKDEEFWLNLPVLKTALPMPLEPYVYITSRMVSGLITKQWLDKNGFPDAPVITVSHPTEKLQHAKNLKLDLYIDDLYSTVREMREAGINAVLMKAPYQRGHIEECKGLPTITCLQESVKYV